MASTVLVYRFEVWDPDWRAFRIADAMATDEAIARMDGRVVAGSARQVDSELVGADGMLVRWPEQGTG